MMPEREGSQPVVVGPERPDPTLVTRIAADGQQSTNVLPRDQHGRVDRDAHARVHYEVKSSLFVDDVGEQRM